MDLLAAWLLFPLAILAVCGGCGLLTERLAGVRVPGVLLVPLGMATTLVVARLAASVSPIARFGLPVLCLLAVGGYAIGRARLWPLRVDGVAVGAAVVAFAIYGAPVLASGEPTFAGYTFLNDTAHQLSLADLLAQHGTDWRSLAPSSHWASVQLYVSTAYPLGSQAALGMLAPLGGLDLVWLYQPFLTVLCALIVLALYGLLHATGTGRAWRALIALTSATPALAVSYALQGSIKEVAVLPMLVLTVALAAAALRGRWPARGLILLAVSSAAALTVLGLAAGLYLALLLAVPSALLLARIRRTRRRSEVGWAAGAFVVGLFLALPVLGSFATAYSVTTSVLSTPPAAAGAARDLGFGHLAAQLSVTQAFGVWLNGDFRYVPVAHRGLSFVLSGMAAGSAALGFLWVLRRRLWAPAVFFTGMLLASLYLLRRGNPYADAKVLMLLSPAVVLMAMLGPLSLREVGRRLEALLLTAALVGGVFASNALAYHDAHLAPYERYRELLLIDRTMAGRGPVILTDWDEFGKYFLRRSRSYNQPEWLHEYQRGNSALSPAYAPAILNPKFHPNIKTPIDLDELTLEYLESVPAVVMRRSPLSSRPPSNYRRTFVGRYYEVWRRESGSEGKVKAHLPIGDDVLQPAAVPSCRAVLRLGRQARSLGARLAFVARPRPAIFNPVSARRRPSWGSYSEYPGTLVPDGPGRVEGTFEIAQGGDYKVWIEGSFGREIDVAVDGRSVGSIAYELSPPGYYFELGSSSLAAGAHQLSIVRGGGDLRPGNGGAQGSLRRLGPVVFSSAPNDRLVVHEVAPNEARQLCGKRLDWIEVVTPSA